MLFNQTIISVHFYSITAYPVVEYSDENPVTLDTHILSLSAV